MEMMPLATCTPPSTSCPQIEIDSFVIPAFGAVEPHEMWGYWGTLFSIVGFSNVAAVATVSVILLWAHRLDGRLPLMEPSLFRDGMWVFEQRRAISSQAERTLSPENPQYPTHSSRRQRSESELLRRHVERLGGMVGR